MLHMHTYKYIAWGCIDNIGLDKLCFFLMLTPYTYYTFIYSAPIMLNYVMKNSPKYYVR